MNQYGQQQQYVQQQYDEYGRPIQVAFHTISISNQRFSTFDFLITFIMIFFHVAKQNRRRLVINRIKSRMKLPSPNTKS